MKKIKLLMVCLAFAPFMINAQTQGMKTTIKVQAMKVATALMENDFNTFVKYMHPDIIAFAGGQDRLKSNMDSAYMMMKRFNVTFKRYWIGDPGDIVKYKGQYQAVLPESTTMITPLGEVTAETSMVVISKDNGKNWWFIDTNVYRAEKLKEMMPDISPKLVIPPAKKPLIKKNEF